MSAVALNYSGFPLRQARSLFTAAKPLRTFLPKPVSPWEATGLRLWVRPERLAPPELSHCKSSNAAGVFPDGKHSMLSYREVRLQWFRRPVTACRMPHLTCTLPCRNAPLGGPGVSTSTSFAARRPCLPAWTVRTPALQSRVVQVDRFCPVSRSPRRLTFVTFGRFRIPSTSTLGPLLRTNPTLSEWLLRLRACCLLDESSRRGSCRSHPFRLLA